MSIHHIIKGVCMKRKTILGLTLMASALLATTAVTPFTAPTTVSAIDRTLTAADSIPVTDLNYTINADLKGLNLSATLPEPLYRQERDGAAYSYRVYIQLYDNQTNQPALSVFNAPYTPWRGLLGNKDTLKDLEPIGWPLPHIGDYLNDGTYYFVLDFRADPTYPNYYGKSATFTIKDHKVYKATANTTTAPSGSSATTPSNTSASSQTSSSTQSTRTATSSQTSSSTASSQSTTNHPVASSKEETAVLAASTDLGSKTLPKTSAVKSQTTGVGSNR